MKGESDPEVMKGQKIAVGSCISCHNFRNAGGRAANSSFFLLAAMAANSKDSFKEKSSRSTLGVSEVRNATSPDV
jgi:mono/diheme cytochrome c family protein